MGTRILPLVYDDSLRDHPHACGDKDLKTIVVVIALGSSPRVWGQEVCLIIESRGIRIIPTRVGTRLNAIRNSASQKDHPHACGDKSMNMSSITSPKGSSPRVWGQDGLNCFDNFFHRIIPTRVGTRSLVCLAVLKLRDHPHACGDKFVIFADILYNSGSSPRVWGQGSVCGDTSSMARIIPTRVGTSTGFGIAVLFHMDHPHACGDKLTTEM